MSAAQQTTPRELNLPHNADFERVILGSIVLQESPDYFFEVADQLRPADFFVGSNRLIFEALSSLAMRGDSLAVLSLVDELKRADNLIRIGGQAYIATLIDGMPRGMYLKTEIKRVRDLSAKRWLMRFGQRLMDRAEEDDCTADEILEGVEKAVVEARGGQLTEDVIDSSTAVDRAVKGMTDRWDETRNHTGVQTGFSDVDAILHGLRPQRLYLLAARPGEGKTTFALNVTHNASQLRRAAQPVVMVVSLEMGSDELIERAIATATRIDADRLIEGGSLTEFERNVVFEAANEIRKLDVHYLDPTSRLLVDSIRARARRLKQKRGRLDLIVIDFLQLLSSSRQDHSEYARLSEISRGLKLLAMTENVPILALSQMSRDIEKRSGRNPEPQLSDLRGSGSLEQDADVVMFLHNPSDNDNATERQLLIKKQRGGKTGIVSLVWFKSQSRFASAHRFDTPMNLPK